MNIKILIHKLEEMGLSSDEATIYLELLKGPSTHLQLSLNTGINRTTIYRVIAELEQRSLIKRRTDDRGSFLCAAEPDALELGIIQDEQKNLQKRQILDDLLPDLNTLHHSNPAGFVVHTYYEQEGFKQMVWHELRAEGELLSFGNGTIEDLIGDPRWARRHRQRQIDAGYRVREIINKGYGNELPPLASDQLLGSGLYQCRVIPQTLTAFDSQTIIYNDTVAIYHWKHDKRIGVEIICPTYAAMMRQIFTHYWHIAAAPHLQTQDV